MLHVGVYDLHLGFQGFEVFGLCAVVFAGGFFLGGQGFYALHRLVISYLFGIQAFGSYEAVGGFIDQEGGFIFFEEGFFVLGFLIG